MHTRRKLLVAAVGVGTTAGLAGCSGGGTPSGSEDEASESAPEEENGDGNGETTEDENTLANFRIENITFTYGFSEGLNADVVLRNITEDGSGINTANVSVEVYDGETRIGETNEWHDINAELTAEYDLIVESVSELADASIDDVTEVRIRGKEENEEYVELETFSGETVRSRIDA